MNIVYPKEQQDISRLCTPNPSNKAHYRSLDSISPTPNRPKLRAIHSSDASRFPTLERLENAMLISKNSKITVEPVTFAADSNNNNMTKGSQVSKDKGLSFELSIADIHIFHKSDGRSIHSLTGSTKSLNHKKKNQAKKKKNHHSTPTEIFAKNLSEAVLDVDGKFT
jgi:hypothetical protein